MRGNVTRRANQFILARGPWVTATTLAVRDASMKIVAIAAILLAGCVGGDVPASGSVTAAAEPTALASSDAGAVQGTVVDTSLLPQAGATVTLKAPEVTAPVLQQVTSS